MKYKRAISCVIAVTCIILVYVMIRQQYQSGYYFYVEEVDEYEPEDNDRVTLSGEDEYSFRLTDTFLTVDNMIFEFGGMKGHEKGEMQVIIFQEDEPIYEYSIPLYVFVDDIFYLYTQEINDWKQDQEHRITVSVKDLEDQQIFLNCCSQDFLNITGVEKNGVSQEAKFPIIGIRGERQALSAEYARSLKSWAVVSSLVILLFVVYGLMLRFGPGKKIEECIGAAVRQAKEKRRETLLYAWLLLVFLFVLIVMGWKLRGELTRDMQKQYWSTDTIIKFQNLALKDREIVQSFRAKSDSLVQSIFGFDNYSREDTGILNASLEDRSGTVYYHWSARVDVLSGQTFYLLADLKEPLKKGKTYYWRFWLEDGSSDITIRAIQNGAKFTGLNLITIDGIEQENMVLYCAQTYSFQHNYLYLWIVVWGTMLIYFCVIFFAGLPAVRRCIRGALFLMSPVFSFFVVELLSGNLETIPPVNKAINIALIFGVYLLIFTLAGKYAFALSNCLFLLIGTVNYYVYAFRNSELIFSDLNSFFTAVTVMNNYVFEISAEIVTAFLITISLIWAYGLTYIRRPLRMTFRRAMQRILFGCCGLLLIYSCMRIPGSVRGSFNFLNLHKSFTTFGWCYSNLILQKHGRLEKPADYSVETAQKIMDTVEDTRPKETVTARNLIVIMNESLSDLEVLGDIQMNKDPLAFIHSLEKNTVRGRLLVQVLGGSTSVTEYEFLTGNSVHFLRTGTIPYSTLCGNREEGLVSILKQQNFYTVAMHPYGASNWNRDRVYPAMGFDTFLSEEAFEGADCIRGYVSDRADYEKIIDLYENKDPEQNLFIFNVTMQNHGGYDVNNGIVEKHISLTEQDCNVAETYLSLAYESDLAFEYLVHYFEQVEEPTMIVLFGDHQPSLPAEFYEAVMGKDADHFNLEEDNRKYETFYLIWTNYESDFEEKQVISTNFLSSYVLDCAGLRNTGYNRFLNSQQDKVSAIGKYGVWIQDQGFIPYSQLDKDTFHDYEILQYMRIVEHKSPVYDFFREIAP